MVCIYRPDYIEYNIIFISQDTTPTTPYTYC